MTTHKKILLGVLLIIAGIIRPAHALFPTAVSTVNIDDLFKQAKNTKTTLNEGTYNKLTIYTNIANSFASATKAAQATQIINEFITNVANKLLQDKQKYNLTSEQLATIKNIITLMQTTLESTIKTHADNQNTSSQRSIENAIKKIQELSVKIDKTMQQQNELSLEISSVDRTKNLTELIAITNRLLQKFTKDIIDTPQDVFIELLVFMQPKISTENEKQSFKTLLDASQKKITSPSHAAYLQQLEQSLITPAATQAGLPGTPSLPGSTPTIGLPGATGLLGAASSSALPVLPGSTPITGLPGAAPITSSPSPIGSTPIGGTTPALPGQPSIQLAQDPTVTSTAGIIPQQQSPLLGSPLLPAADTQAAQPHAEPPVDKAQILNNLLSAQTIEAQTQAITAGLDALNKITIAKEKQEIVTSIEKKYNDIYTKRAGKNAEELKAIHEIFEKGSAHGDIRNKITAEHITTIKMLSLISQAQEEADISQKLSLIDQTVDLVTKKTNLYEKTLFSDMITTIFSTRKELTKEHREAFLAILQKLQGKKDIFGKNIIAQFTSFYNIIQAGLAFLFPTPQSNFNDLLNFYKSHLNTLKESLAIEEKAIFNTKVAPALWEHKGNLRKQELQGLNNFLKTALAVPSLFTGTLATTVKEQMQELGTAIAITSRVNTYLEALIQKAQKDLNPTLYTKALNLFTIHTTDSIRSNFISALNELFNNRTKLSISAKKELLELITTIAQKRISPTIPFLSPAQKNVIENWVTTLSNEIKALS